MDYAIYGITGYSESAYDGDWDTRYRILENYTLIKTGDGSLSETLDVSGYSGFAIFSKQAIGIDKILLDGKALTTSVQHRLITGNLDVQGNYTKTLQQADSQFIAPKYDYNSWCYGNRITNSDGGVLVFSTKSAKSLTVGLKEVNFLGTDAADTLSGTADNNLIIGRNGDDNIACGKGTDTVAYIGNYANYTVVVNADGSLSITDTVGSEGSDTVSGAEKLIFNDKIVDLATEDLIVENVNQAPIKAKSIADQAAIEDKVFKFAVDAKTFSDTDKGDVLSYSATLTDGSALPSWLSFDASTRTFTGAPSNDAVGSLNLRITATDLGKLSVSTDFKLTIANTNDAPTATNTIADQTAKEGSAFSFVVPNNTFADGDIGDSLTLAATLANGKALPKWLKFDNKTDTFSGTPADADTGKISIKVIATDKGKATVSDTFDLVIENVNQAPVVSKTIAIAPQKATEGKPFSFTLPKGLFTDADKGDALTLTAHFGEPGQEDLITLTPNPLTSWIHFDPKTGKISGTPSHAAAGSTTVTITATDKAGASVSTSFKLETANVSVIKGTDKADAIEAAAGDDSVAGGKGNDTLAGGTGNDTLTGGDGADQFVFDSVLDAKTNLDVITDFKSGTDKIVLSTRIFTMFGMDTDLSDNFVSGQTLVAPDADDYLYFDIQTKILSYDADGSGTDAAPVAICKLTGVTTLQVSDIALTYPIM